MEFYSPFWDLQWRIQDFPEEGSQRWGHQLIVLVNFPQKVHENKKKWDRWVWGGGRVPGAHPCPLRSANGLLTENKKILLANENRTMCHSRVGVYNWNPTWEAMPRRTPFSTEWLMAREMVPNQLFWKFYQMLNLDQIPVRTFSDINKSR